MFVVPLRAVMTGGRQLSLIIARSLQDPASRGGCGVSKAGGDEGSGVTGGFGSEKGDRQAVMDVAWVVLNTPGGA